MIHLRLARNLFNVPLLVTPERAAEIERAFRAHEDGLPALLAPPIEVAPRQELLAPGHQRADAGYIRTEQDVAIIEIVGTLVQRGDSMDAASGLVGYNRIANQLHAAVNDPRVLAIMLEIDSPGGEANGVIDLAGKIRAAAARKPVAASANERAYSGAMWLASAASSLTAPSTAMVGSIGVVMLHVDQSQRDAKQGLVYTPIFAGQRKVDFSSHAPLSDAAYQVAQEEVDRLYEMFTSAIADMRGIDQQTVIDTEAGLLNAHKALSLGLIDGVQSFEEALASLAQQGRDARHGMRAAANPPAILPELAALSARAREINHEGDINMEPTKPAAQVTAAELQSAVTNAMVAGAASAATAQRDAEAMARADAEAKTAIKNEGAKAGAESERARINAILTHKESEGRRAQAEHLAFKTAMTVEDAAALMAASAKDGAAKPTNAFAAHMDALGNPKLASDAAAGPGDDEGQQLLAGVVEKRNKAVVASIGKR